MNQIQSKDIMVTIYCTAYNHESYIRQCLDGFVMQKTNFKFEAIVHDDASTDNTANIIREYASKYPDIIKPIYQTENQYSKHDGTIRRLFHKNTRGKYVAMCEGDDYWTDPLKLQKQVDFLESHPGYVMCSHRYDEYQQATGEFTRNTIHKDVDYDLISLVCGEWLFHPLSIMYSAAAFDKEHYSKYGISIDAALIYELLRNGKKGRCLGDTMAVYRIHTGGVWSGKSETKKWDLEFKVRMNLYKVEQSKPAAQFLLSEFSRPLGRKWMIQNRNMFYKVFKIFCKHFGFYYTTKLFFNKICLGRIINLRQV